MSALDAEMIDRVRAPNVCIWCGELYEPNPIHANPRRVYCCQACQKQAWRRDIKAEGYCRLREVVFTGKKFSDRHPQRGSRDAFSLGKRPYQSCERDINVGGEL